MFLAADLVERVELKPGDAERQKNKIHIHSSMENPPEGQEWFIGSPFRTPHVEPILLQKQSLTNTDVYKVCPGPTRVRVIDPPFILGGGASSTTLPFSHINGKYFSINRSNSSSTIQPWTLTTKVTSSHRLSRSNILSTEFHSRTWLSRAELNENVTRVTKMINSVNAFEVIVGSVPDNHLAKSSVFAHSASVISSFRRAGWLLKLSRGKSGSPADELVNEGSPRLRKQPTGPVPHEVHGF